MGDMEWRCALAARGLDYIHPVALVDPRTIPPPRDLMAKHFKDLKRALIEYEKGVLKLNFTRCRHRLLEIAPRARASGKQFRTISPLRGSLLSHSPPGLVASNAVVFTTAFVSERWRDDDSLLPLPQQRAASCTA
jgi:hypothetical protein